MILSNADISSASGTVYKREGYKMYNQKTLSRRQALTGGAVAGILLSAPQLTQASALAPASAAPPPPAAQPVKVMPAITEYIAAASTADVPEDVLDRGRLHILDTLTSILACRNLEAADLGRKYARALSGGPSASHAILGSKERANIIDAVFASAMAGHGAEINDFIPSAFVQPGPSIVSAALAVAEGQSITGRQVLKSVIAGYELAGRIPKTIGLKNLQKAAIANHGIGPVFGTAAAVASLKAMTPDQVGHVLSYCAQQASGSWQWMLDVRHIEKSFVFAGMGARNGLQAALMVEQGFTGVPDCFDIPGGWLLTAAFSGGDANRNYLIEKLGERFEMQETAVKKYPTGGPTQPAIEALLDMRKKLDPKDVARIHIAMPGRADAFRDAAMPALNLPYLASIIMLDGHLDFESAQSLERMHQDPAVQEFRKKVSVVHDAAQEAVPHEARTESARVTIHRHKEPAMEKYVAYVAGFPSHPMNRTELVDKCRHMLEPILGANNTRELISRASYIDGEQDVSKLIKLVCI
jgi:2-methylcitrate dehydratase PrpD